MKTTFALLADHETSNFVRKMAWQIHQTYRTGIDICRLPPHISLKQPFDIADVAALESYMAELAEGIRPFEVSLPTLQLVATTIAGRPSGILWLDVEETPRLRQLHNRLNQELAVRFGNTKADFDGSSYHFHMTVTMGGQPLEVYRKIYQEFGDPPVGLRYEVHELAMFVYDQGADQLWDYMTYKILPI